MQDEYLDFVHIVDSLVKLHRLLGLRQKHHQYVGLSIGTRRLSAHFSSSRMAVGWRRLTLSSSGIRSCMVIS